jgi:polar amino acid transport system substrate-binding protein
MTPVGMALLVPLLVGCFIATGAEAKNLELIAPNIPPHFNADGRGRIGDVVREALNRCGHSVHFTMVPFGRHWKDYTDNSSFDGLATAEADQEFPGYSTKAFMHLQDGASVIGDHGLASITSVDQLKGKRVVAFPDADKILDIQALVPDFKSFNMRADRFDQIRPLFAARADAILADGLITANFIRVVRERARAGLEPDIEPNLPILFRKIFAAGPQRLYFHEQAISLDFDRCVQELRVNNEIERITKPYVDAYRDILGDQYPNY